MIQNSDLMIFVGGLESTTTNRDLLEHFGSFGVVRFCEVQCWKNNPTKYRGFAIMDIGDPTTYENILLTSQRLNGRPIEVKKLIVDKSELEEHTQSLNDRKVFVSNLPKKLTDVQLHQFFSQYGKVELAYIIKHHKDGKSKGFGFVLYHNKEDKEAVTQLADKIGFNIDGRKIACSSYVAKNKKSSGDNSSQSLSPQFEVNKKAAGSSNPKPFRSSPVSSLPNMLDQKKYSLGRDDRQHHNANIVSDNRDQRYYFNNVIASRMTDNRMKSRWNDEAGNSKSIFDDCYQKSTIPQPNDGHRIKTLQSSDDSRYRSNIQPY